MNEMNGLIFPNAGSRKSWVVVETKGGMKTTEKFAIRKDPSNSNSSNWGIIWEKNGTEGGFTSEAAARKSALAQNGMEAASDESQCWDWV